MKHRTLRLLLLWIRPPRGVEVRRLVGWIALAQGLAYLILALLPEPMTMFRGSLLGHFMPMWSFGALLACGGTGLLWTLTRRQSVVGRGMAVFTAMMYGLYLGTFPTGALTAYAIYGTLTYALLGEASA